MKKKGKKGPPPKHGKGAGKSTKKQTSTRDDTGQPSTSTQEPEEMTDPPPSGSASTSQDATSDSKKPSEVIVMKCEEIEKLAVSIQKKCNVTPQTKKQPKVQKSPESVQELEFLVSEIKKLAQTVDFGEPPPIPTAPRPQEPTDPIVFYDVCPFTWPRTKERVPYIFLHPPINIRHHIRDILLRNIEIYFPRLEQYYTKLLCRTFEHHRELVKYFEEKELPFHTFGYLSNKMMKVIIRGLPKDVDLNKMNEELIAASIPVVRFHVMNARTGCKSKFKSVLFVVPENEEGKKLLRLKSVFGHIVKVEAPLPKSKQCHRCQKWGHAQRYCQGKVKCVKCAGDHFSKDCTRDPSKEPPKCANCSREHTASYRRCKYCPDSEQYKEGQRRKTPKRRIDRLLTLANCPRI